MEPSTGNDLEGRVERLERRLEAVERKLDRQGGTDPKAPEGKVARAHARLEANVKRTEDLTHRMEDEVHAMERSVHHLEDTVHASERRTDDERDGPEAGRDEG